MKTRFVGLFAAALLFILAALPASALSWVVPDEGWIVNGGTSAIVQATIVCDTDALVYITARIEQPSGRLMAQGFKYAGPYTCVEGQEITDVLQLDSTGSPFKNGPASVYVTLAAYEPQGGGLIKQTFGSGTIKLHK